MHELGYADRTAQTSGPQTQAGRTSKNCMGVRESTRLVGLARTWRYRRLHVSVACPTYDELKLVRQLRSIVSDEYGT